MPGHDAVRFTSASDPFVACHFVTSSIGNEDLRKLLRMYREEQVGGDFARIYPPLPDRPMDHDIKEELHKLASHMHAMVYNDTRNATGSRNTPVTVRTWMHCTIIFRCSVPVACRCHLRCLCTICFLFYFVSVMDNLFSVVNLSWVPFASILLWLFSVVICIVCALFSLIVLVNVCIPFSFHCDILSACHHALLYFPLLTLPWVLLVRVYALQQRPRIYCSLS